MRLCCQCVHLRAADGQGGVVTEDALCFHPKMMLQEPQSLVTGYQDPPKPLLARVARDMEHPCGKAGKLFELGPSMG